MAQLLDRAAAGPQGPVEFTVPGVHTEAGDVVNTTSLLDLGVGCRWFRCVIYQRGFTAGSGSVGVLYSLSATGDSNNITPLQVGSVVLPRRQNCMGVIEGLVATATYLSRVQIHINTVQGDTLSYDFMIDATP